MNSQAKKVDTILRVVCAVATSLAAALFVLMFVGLCVEAVRRHEFDSLELGLPIALALIGLLALFSAHIAWTLWRGSLSSNGITMMPTWFLKMFGVFSLAGYVFLACLYPTYVLLGEGVFVAFVMIVVVRQVAKKMRASSRQ